jgi:hypothetical protein
VVAYYYVILTLHLVGAAIWTGGHIVLATRVLPRALREKKADLVRAFEEPYESIGMPALVVQIVTGLLLAHRLLGAPTNWFADSGMARVVQLKLLFLAGTAALAIHAKTRVIPRLTDANLPVLGWHIRAVTVLSILFVLAGASLRLGGFPLFH